MDSTINRSIVDTEKKVIYNVSFKAAPNKNNLTRIYYIAKECLNRISLRSLSNAYYVATQNDISKMFMRSWKYGSYLSDCPTPTGTVW